jgi:uncharacterized protein YaiE (UPF0345 family)
MESKKINQLATELAPELSDLTIIGDPTTGISKKITLSQMASLFTGTVEEYASLSAFPLVGTADTIYIALDTNILYRWNTGTSAYVELSPNVVSSLVFNDANGFDGTISLVGSVATLTITTALTQGSVPFIGASGALTQDNANLFFDDTNNRLGINTNSPTTALDVFGSGIIGRLNGTSTNNAFLGFASAGSNKWSVGNVQSDHRFRIYNEATISELVSVLETGEFGIGIANPTTKLHIDGGVSALIANLDANVSVAKSLSFRSDNSARINLEVSGTESGSNAGANFFIRRYSDAGALIDTPLTIVRSTGNIGIGYTTPTELLDIRGADRNVSSAEFNQVIYSTTSQDAGRGGSLGFGGFHTSTTSEIQFSGLKGAKENGNGGNTAGYLSLHTRPNAGAMAERMRISSTGNVGVGVIPSNWSGMLGLDIGTNAGIANFTDYALITTNTFFNSGWFRKVDGFAASIFLRRDEGSIWFNTSANGAAGSSISAINTRMIITNSGNVGIGTSSPDSLLEVSKTDGIITQRGGTGWSIYRSYGGDGSTANLVEFQIRNRVDGFNMVSIGNFSNHDLTFRTANTERMRITASGIVGIGGTVGAGRLQAWGENQSSSNYALGVYNSGGFGIFFVRNDGAHFLSSFTYNNTVSGGTRSVYIDNSYALGGISSIRKSKKNIEEFNSEWIYDLKPVQFNYRKKDKEGNYTEEIYDEINYGLIAEDTAPIADFLINYNEKEDGSKEMVGIEYMRLITPMLKEIQELKKEIEILKLK